MSPRPSEQRSLDCRLKKKRTSVWSKTRDLPRKSEEANRRKQLETTSFQKLNKIRQQNHNKTSKAQRKRLYEIYVTPILSYNACTWALTKAEMQKLDACRRKHLRSILGIKNIDTISNENYYRRCKTR